MNKRQIKKKIKMAKLKFEAHFRRLNPIFKDVPMKWVDYKNREEKERARDLMIEKREERQRKRKDHLAEIWSRGKILRRGE